MKVLPEGKTKWSIVVDCSCGAKLEVEESDLKVVNTACFYAGETWDPEISITCPVCKTSMHVTDRVPYGMSSAMMAAARSNK